MATAEGKKRYYLTMTEDTFEQYKSMLRGMGAPAGTESVLIDEYVRGMVETVLPIVQKAKESGRNVSFGEFMIMVGKAFSEQVDEQLKL